MGLTIELKDGSRNFKVVGVIERVPREHAGWQSIRYQGKRYPLRGGIRVEYFINIDNPIKRRV